MSKGGGSAISFTFGLLLVALGILFLLDNFTYLPVWHYVWRFWPLILIVFGLSKIFSSIKKG